LTGRSHVQMVAQLLKLAENLEEAKEFIQSQDHMSTETLVIADGSVGDGAVFEMNAAGIGIRTFDADVVFATNHFVHEEMKPLHAAPGQGSLSRFLRFTQLIPPDGEDSLWAPLTALDWRP